MTAPSRDEIVNRLATVTAKSLRGSGRVLINQLRADAKAWVLSGEDGAWVGECLDMVLERLQAYLGPDAIAPMFYDDAITAVAHRAAFGKLPEEMYPEGSLLHRLRDAEKERDQARRQRDAWKTLYEAGL